MRKVLGDANRWTSDPRKAGPALGADIAKHDRCGPIAGRRTDRVADSTHAPLIGMGSRIAYNMVGIRTDGTHELQRTRRTIRLHT